MTTEHDFFITQARVYYEDTDAGGVVFYANYLKYMERARTEWLRQLGVEQRALAAEADTLFAVVNVNINYRRPARLDDLLDIGARVVEQGRTSLIFEQFVRRASDGEILADGRVKVACLGAASFRPRAIPAFILERLKP